MKNLFPPNIEKLSPYSSARDEFSAESDYTLLDANENPYAPLTQISPEKISQIFSNLNTYPDPNQTQLRETFANYINKNLLNSSNKSPLLKGDLGGFSQEETKNISPQNLIFGNGSDELLDLITRMFCQSAHDEIIICPPTFGMYSVIANIQNLKITQIPLIENPPSESSDLGGARGGHTYKLPVDKILQNRTAKILFIPNPAAPSGNLFTQEDLQEILKNFPGIVVIDEAYINFTQNPEENFQIKNLVNFPNLIITQTFSKYYGLAGIRLGVAIASSEIIQKISAIKAPYNVNKITQDIAIEVLKNPAFLEAKKQILITQREKFWEFLSEKKFVTKLFQTDTNYIYFEVESPAISDIIYQKLLAQKIVIRRFGENRLRISIGTPEIMEKLQKILNQVR